MLIRVTEEHLSRGMDTDIWVNPLLLALDDAFPGGAVVPIPEENAMAVTTLGVTRRYVLPPVADLFSRRFHDGWYKDELGTIEFELVTGGT